MHRLYAKTNLLHTRDSTVLRWECDGILVTQKTVICMMGREGVGEKSNIYRGVTPKCEAMS